MKTVRIRHALGTLRASLVELRTLAYGRWSLRRARRVTQSLAVEDPAPSATRPILLVVDDRDPFGRYLSEILTCEGFAAFGVIDRSGLTETLLSDTDLVVLAPMRISPDHRDLLDRFVIRGGRLLAIRPDGVLGGTLGLRSIGSSYAGGYVHIETGAPWSGTTRPLKVDAPGDVFESAGATPVATISSEPGGPHGHVAASIHVVGQHGGRAAAFTFDLARSIVHARQGNPAWVVRDRRSGPSRAMDLFVDPDSGRLAWPDDERLNLPRADEIQRLFANVIVHLTVDCRPAPRFWYLPKGEPAALVLTGDDHGKADVGSRFERLRALGDPDPGSDDGGTTMRATSYVWPDVPRRDAAPQLTEAEAKAYAAQGFEIALHPNAGRNDHRPEKLAYHLERSIKAWRSRYPTLPAPATLRWHCVAWAGWIEPALLERAHGVRLDLNYYFFPSEVVRDRAGFFTGSAMPMRFADLDGRRIDVFQLCTQLTDESGQSYPDVAEALLDAARGEEAFYGVFAANVHTTGDDDDPTLERLTSAAQARRIPVISAGALLGWIDERQASSCEVGTWSGKTLTLSVRVPPAAAGRVTLLVPVDETAPDPALAKSGAPVPARRMLVRGIRYVAFEPDSGTYELTYEDRPGAAATSRTEEEAIR